MADVEQTGSRRHLIHYQHLKYMTRSLYVNKQKVSPGLIYTQFLYVVIGTEIRGTTSQRGGMHVPDVAIWRCPLAGFQVIRQTTDLT